MKHQIKSEHTLAFGGGEYSGGWEGTCVCGFKVETFGSYGKSQHIVRGERQLVKHLREKNWEEMDPRTALAEAREIIDRLTRVLLGHQEELAKHSSVTESAQKFLKEY